MKRFVLLAATAGLLVFSSVALAGPSLLGKWKETIKNDSAFHGQLDGTWVISFSGGKHYTAKFGGQSVEKGTFKVSGSKITFHATAETDACTATGKYKFKISGKKLRLTAISDSKASCAGRKDVLTHGAFSEDTGSGLIGGY